MISLKMELLLWKAIQKKYLQNSEKDEAIREKEECNGEMMAIGNMTKRTWKSLY